MAKSLAGGLLPLGPRTGSSTAVSSSTLTGGLIPLGNKSRPSDDRDDQEDCGWGGGGSRWSGKEEDSGLEEERLGSESHPDKKVCLSLSIYSTTIYCSAVGKIFKSSADLESSGTGGGEHAVLLRGDLAMPVKSVVTPA